MARAGRLAAVLLLSGTTLVCSPAVVPAPRVDLEMESSPALALVTQVPTRATVAAASAPAAAPAADAAPAAAEATPFVFPDRPEQWFIPGGRNQGTENLAMFLAGIALLDNAPLYISETVGRTTGSANSDHYIGRTDSWAVDVAVRGIQVPTPQTYLAAKRISTALGVPDWPGGDLTRTIGNYRVQVLWLVAGHYNHVHVGIRRVT